MANPTDWYPQTKYRKAEGLGLWEHRGRVAVAGIGTSLTARRWDGDLATSLGALQIQAAQKALDEAGITVDDVDGVVACPQGMGDPWAPRPYFPPPYDTEDGLSGVSADWLVKNMGLRHVRTTYHAQTCISKALAAGAQIVGDGEAHTVLVIRATGNLEGRYHETEEATASGPQQWTNPWSWALIPQTAFAFDQYCRKYGSNHDRMAPFVVNQHANGLMCPEGYYAQHRPQPLTTEEYLRGRWVCKPLNLYDADMPIQIAGAFLCTTAERARDMRQKPVYILNHNTNQMQPRSMVETLEEIEGYAAHLARKMWEGSGLTAKDVDIFNPYDGFALFTQYFLEGFGWRGVQRGEAHDFYAGDISVHGPNPFSSSGGNLGNGRTRWWGYYDCIQQLRGQAGARQVRVKAETGLAGAFTPSNSDWLMFSTHPD